MDFETNATGVLFSDNYVHRSYGAGIMVFGHADGSNTGLRVTGNTMLYNGCNQTAGDHGGIGFMRLGSSGVITGNTFATCAGTPLFMQLVPGAAAGWDIAGNVVDGVNASVRALDAPAVACSGGGGGAPLVVRATSDAPGGAIVYTLDGSRPRAGAAPWPAAGLSLPPRATAVNVKVFPPGRGAAAGVVVTESPTNGGICAPPPRS